MTTPSPDAGNCRATPALNRKRIRMISCFRALLILTVTAALAGCGVVAAPVRGTSAVVKVVPVAGDAVAAPLDVTADVID
jgi:hypothetical protein